jgi:hypothetical protein
MIGPSKPSSLLFHSKPTWSVLFVFNRDIRVQRPNSWMKLGQKSEEFSSLLFTVTSTNGFYSPPPPPPSLSKSGLKLFCNINILYGNLESENSQDYGQKPPRNCTFVNSASVF